MPGQVAKLDPEQQQLAAQQQRKGDRRTEEHEYESKASASTGINLNIFAAVSGIFSGKSKKTSHTDANGETHTTEDFEGHNRVKSAGHSTLNAVSNASSSTKERHRITDESMQDDRKMIQGKSEPSLEDGNTHKGIEGAKK